MKKLIKMFEQWIDPNHFF